MSLENAAAPVTLAMLKRLHHEHLSRGPTGTAEAIRRFADDLGTSTTGVVGGVRLAAGSAERETAGWANAVLPYLDSAIACGALEIPVNPPTNG